MPENCLIIMVKSPRIGEVKKRLSRTVGEKNAAAIYRRCVLDLIDGLEKFSSGKNFDIFIGFHPPSDCECIDAWLGISKRKIPQQGNDLGEKQALLLQAGFDLGYSAVSVMASDLPDLPAERVFSAFEKLNRYDCVIGPSQDGGYFLIGFSRRSFNVIVFRDMEWSHPGVTGEMIKRLEHYDMSWSTTEPWPDIDTAEDLRSLIIRHSKKIGSPPVRTLAFLREHDLP
jgi:hypothetical protein